MEHRDRSGSCVGIKVHVSTSQKSAMLGTANILRKVLLSEVMDLIVRRIYDSQELQYQCLLCEIEDATTTTTTTTTTTNNNNDNNTE